MKCLILAAGYATRLYPLTENFPKPLLAVGEKTILDWLVDDIVTTGSIDEFVVISNHKFAKHFADWAKEKEFLLGQSLATSAPKFTVVDDGTSTNENRLGAVRDIQFAVDKLGIADDMLVIAGDNILDFSFAGFLKFASEKGTSYEEKPKEPKGNLAVPPFYFYRAEDAACIPEALENGCNADAPGSFAAWLSHQTAVHAWVMPGKRYDIGDVKSYEYVKSVFAK